MDNSVETFFYKLGIFQKVQDTPQLPELLYKKGETQKKNVFLFNEQELTSTWLSTSNFSTVRHISCFFELERMKVCLLQNEQILFRDSVKQAKDV